MRAILRWFLDSAAVWFITLFVCIWMAARYWYEAVTEGFTVLRIVKACLVTALGVGWVIRALIRDQDE